MVVEGVKSSLGRRSIFKDHEGTPSWGDQLLCGFVVGVVAVVVEMLLFVLLLLRLSVVLVYFDCFFDEIIKHILLLL